MVPELNKEYPQEDEHEIFAEMVDETISEMGRSTVSSIVASMQRPRAV